MGCNILVYVVHSEIADCMLGVVTVMTSIFIIPGDTVVLNPGTGHKKDKSVSGVFQEGGTMVFDTQTKETKYDPLP